jgi:biotin carboxylase
MEPAMQNFVCLSPHFPENFQFFWQRLHEAGVRVLGIADSSWDSLSPRVRESLTEYYKVEDMHNHSQLEEACRHFVARYGPIDRLESHNEYWLETEAYLRSRFNIPGTGEERIRDIKSKERMKELYRQGNIPVAAGRVVQNEADCRAFIAQVGFPVVVKPDIGVGAAKTWKLESEQDLSYFINECDKIPYLMEEFIQGDLYSYDGLTNADGEIIFAASQYFCNGIMTVVNHDLDLSHLTLREIPKELEALGKKVVQTFGIRERFFHFEFFHKPNGDWVALEVNIRPPGGLSMDMFNFANDIDLYKGYAELLTTGKLQQTAMRNEHVAYIGRKNRNYRLTHQDVLQRFKTDIIHHQAMAEIFYPVMGHTGYLVRSEDRMHIENLIREIQATD